MKIILLVTWIVGNQTPSSHQVEFDNWEKCPAAQNSVFQDRDRMLKTMGSMIMGPGIHLPVVSAVCAAK
jgi:hypothetical protein